MVRVNSARFFKTADYKDSFFPEGLLNVNGEYEKQLAYRDYQANPKVNLRVYYDIYGKEEGDVVVCVRRQGEQDVICVSNTKPLESPSEYSFDNPFDGLGVYEFDIFYQNKRLEYDLQLRLT